MWPGQDLEISFREGLVFFIEMSFQVADVLIQLPYTPICAWNPGRQRAWISP